MTSGFSRLHKILV